MAAIDQLSGLMNLIGGLKGQSSTSTTSGGTKTTQANVSDQGIQQILNQILSGSGGVKSIGNRARSSGLYNSTGEDILLGNLYATAANQAELARTPTVVTSAPTVTKTEGSKTSVGDLATGLGGAFLASQALNIGAKALSPAVDAGSNYVSDLLSGLFGVGSNDSSKVKLGDVDVGVGGGFGGSIGSSGTGISTGEGFGLNTSTLENFGGSSNVQGAKGVNFGFDTDTGATSVGVGGLGSIGGLLGGLVSAVTGGSGGSSGGGGGGTSGGSVICTALKDQGILDVELHAAGAKYLNAMDPLTVVGYQVWGNKIADKIRDGHKGWIAVSAPIAISRTALLASSGSFRDHLKYPLGTITKFIGEPICHLIGAMLPKSKLIPLRDAYFAQKGV